MYVFNFIQFSFVDNIFETCQANLTQLCQITQYLSDPQYYFQVNSQYVRNKLKVVLFPFFHRVSAVALSPFFLARFAYCEVSYLVTCILRLLSSFRVIGRE